MEKCNKWSSADEAIASLPEWMQASFKDAAPGKVAHPEPEFYTRGSTLGLAALERAETAEPVVVEKPAPYMGRIAPSIHVNKGDALSMWHVNGTVEVVIRDGNGYEHFGKLAAPLNAEGGFGPAAEPQDEGFRQKLFELFIQPERENDFITTDDGEQVAVRRGGDKNYTHRATCLWTSRNYAGAPHSRAFLIVTWDKMASGFQYPVEALLMDGDKVFTFKLLREQSGGDRPNWKGRAV